MSVQDDCGDEGWPLISHSRRFPFVLAHATTTAARARFNKNVVQTRALPSSRIHNKTIQICAESLKREKDHTAKYWR